MDFAAQDGFHWANTLVGRDPESAQLLDREQQACAGELAVGRDTDGHFAIGITLRTWVSLRTWTSRPCGRVWSAWMGTTAAFAVKRMLARIVSCFSAAIWIHSHPIAGQLTW